MRDKEAWGIKDEYLKIYERYQNGESIRMIAMDNYVSTQWIYDIIKKVRLYKGEEVYKDPYDLRYLPDITPRSKKLLIKRGVKNIRDLGNWIKTNRLIEIPGIGEGIENRLLRQYNEFLEQNGHSNDSTIKVDYLDENGCCVRKLMVESDLKNFSKENEVRHVVFKWLTSNGVGLNRNDLIKFGYIEEVEECHQKNA